MVRETAPPLLLTSSPAATPAPPDTTPPPPNTTPPPASTPYELTHLASRRYALSVVADPRARLSREALVAAALALTLLLLVPSGLELLQRPRRPTAKREARRFLLAMGGSALAFFLGSFQVHEKSALFFLAPLSLLAADEGLSDWATWLALAAAHSMYPLLKRDGLVAPYLACAALYLFLAAAAARPEERPGDAGPEKEKKETARYPGGRVVLRAFLVGAAALHAGEALVAPPARYPDLWPALFALFGCANFALAYAGVSVLQWRC